MFRLVAVILLAWLSTVSIVLADIPVPAANGITSSGTVRTMIAGLALSGAAVGLLLFRRRKVARIGENAPGEPSMSNAPVPGAESRKE